MADFVEIYNVCARKAIIEAAKRIINSDKVCHSYSDLNFGVTFWNTVYIGYICKKNNVYKNGYRRLSCTSKTANIHRLVNCNVPFHYYSASIVLLSHKLSSLCYYYYHTHPST